MASDSEQLVRNRSGCVIQLSLLTVKSQSVSRLCKVMGNGPVGFINNNNKNYIEHVFISQESSKGLLGATLCTRHRKQK